MSVSIWQLLIVLAIILIFFGPSRIPRLGKSIGEFLQSFKSEKEGRGDIDITDS